MFIYIGKRMILLIHSFIAALLHNLLIAFYASAKGNPYIICLSCVASS